MIRPSVVTGLAAAFLIAAHAHAHACAPQSAVELSSDDEAPFKAYADIQLTALSKPFNVDLYFCGGENSKVERIKIDAIMPAHQHGMNYEPQILELGDGKFQATSMFFHMPGIWQLQVSAYHLSAENAKPILFTHDIKAQ